jgi:hypothetical protein
MQLDDLIVEFDGKIACREITRSFDRISVPAIYARASNWNSQFQQALNKAAAAGIFRLAANCGFR